ncbi:MAG: signal peptidase II [Propionibacteriaceae bacterium]|jgi:signal peptidase II|nr:signal peptidase II [Propionibacteriaceae bacterium]
MQRSSGAVAAVMRAVAILGAIADQLTKQWALRTLATVDSEDSYSWFDGFLRFRLAFNSGAAFSMGSGFTVVFSLLSIAAGLVIIWGTRTKLHKLWQGALAGLLLAGIIGNLCDRLTREPGPLRGLVVDFISVKWFAVFNVADIFITCAAILMGVWVLLAERRQLDMFTWLPAVPPTSDTLAAEDNNGSENDSIQPLSAVTPGEDSNESESEPRLAAVVASGESGGGLDNDSIQLSTTFKGDGGVLENGSGQSTPPPTPPYAPPTPLGSGSESGLVVQSTPPPASQYAFPTPGSRDAGESASTTATDGAEA